MVGTVPIEHAGVYRRNEDGPPDLFWGNHVLRRFEVDNAGVVDEQQQA
jgi:hypothetical protein